MNPIRVRLAPSPTGSLHIGTARTGLFNYLFAKKLGGTFVLRIEDTDLERSEPAFEKDILEHLTWLGLSWDEGPYRQSERLDIYEKYLIQLFEKGDVYYCFCREEELEIERQEMMTRGVAPKYSGRCSHLSREQAEQRAVQGESSVIRFRMPETRIAFEDMIRGKVEFDTSLFGDVVIAKNVRTPLYNFAVVVDDFEMKISHVIRGEDHISNTPKQIALQRALGFTTPEYAHLPLILDKNRAKLSKRFNAVSILEYKNSGYLPEALFNFIALLGWHPSISDAELLTQEELIEQFDISRVQKAGAIFDIEKLNWMNAHYVKEKTPEELVVLLTPFLPEEWVRDKEKLVAIISLEQERMKRFSEFSDLARFFFDLPEYEAQLLVWKTMSLEMAEDNLKIVLGVLGAYNEIWNTSAVETLIMPLTESRGRGEMLWPLRVALSGQSHSPGPFEIAGILGKEDSIRRIELALQKLAALLM
ncbi:MAG: glutamate--tRNA ligase [Parcubacteria group bacterium]|nr:glutamate--tRNA ligase [Parcubacteria group bacterium]